MTACDLRRAAEEYLTGGLSVLPALRIEKRPAVKGRWEPFKKRLPDKAEVSAWFANTQDALCLVCGAVSGNLEIIDFDCAGEFFEPWRATVGAAAPGLLDRLVIESTPSGGRHIAYRCETQVSGNMKLAQRRRPVADHEVRLNAADREVVDLYGKEYIVRTDADETKYVLLTLIETRGEGGIILCAPTVGYELSQGDLAALPALTAEKRDILLETAWSLNEYWPEPVNPTPSVPHESGLRPGDDFNERGDVRAVLIEHGWLLARAGENEYWRRPGKTRGWSATLKDRVFYIFSSNAAPFEPNRAYSLFAVYTQLECGGDFELAARALRQQGYGGDSPVESSTDVDISGILAMATQAAVAQAESAISRPRSLRQLVEDYPALREPVITGLLREGETMNVISAPKIGKSWLVIDLALAVAMGRPWLGMHCVPGDVLILDNELHGETSANRIPKVAAARGIEIESVADHVYVENLRGRLQDLFALGPYFRQFEPGRFKVVILDAFYRFLPMRADENDNGTMANLYNYLDSFADYLECSFVLIHHTSKGSQSSKDVTDVGAGAGAQSRATDTHLVLRRHEEDDVVVLAAAARSWPPVLPRCLRWAFPVWMPADDLDPAALRREGGRKKAREDNAKHAPSYDPASFAQHFLGEEPRSHARILEEAESEGMSSRRVKRLLDLAEEDGLAFRRSVGPRKTLAYATVEQPEDEKHDDSRRAAVETLLRDEPGLSTKDVAERCGVTVRYVQIIRRKLKAN